MREKAHELLRMVRGLMRVRSEAGRVTSNLILVLEVVLVQCIVSGVLDD